MNNKEIIDMIHTDVRVLGPSHNGKTDVLTMDLSSAKLMLQNGEFIATGLLISSWTRPRRISWFNLGIMPAEEERLQRKIRNEDDNIHGVEGEIPGQPEEVAEKLRKWGIDEIDMVHREFGD
ncbi:hypothetical protein [Natrinema sp. H-ect4]|uniref:hypothetical protein n=1 Tax=Natrinema sp. H-ect4 TaxID=3242699 RepID=UPI0035A8DAC4